MDNLILFGIVLGTIAKPVVKRVNILLTKRKLELLKLELITLERLLKQAQEDCFRTKKINQTMYKLKEKRYVNRKAEIKHIIPVLEGIISGNKKVIKKEIKKKGVIEIKR
jgi:hypothetical protein